MNQYNKFSEGHNGQLEMFEHEHEERPTRRAVHKLAKRAGTMPSRGWTERATKARMSRRALASAHGGG
jgi:hypothetical protein